MARHLVEVWRGDHQKMSAAAWSHAQQFSWQQSMEQLFGTLYPRALHRAAARAEGRLAGVGSGLVEA